MGVAEEFRHVGREGRRLSENLPTAKILDEIFKTKGLQEFKKAEFAKLIRESIQYDSDVSSEIIAIVDEIRNNI